MPMNHSANAPMHRTRGRLPRMVAVDCEMVPHPAMFELAAQRSPEFAAPSNWKDPAKIKARIAEQREAWYTDLGKKCTFDKRLGMIVSIALWDGDLRGGLGAGAVASLGGAPADGGEPLLTLDSSPPPPYHYRFATEAELLQWFWSGLVRGAWDGIVSYNGIDFDVPYIEYRSGVCGIAPTRDLSTRRDAWLPNCDLLQWDIRWSRAELGGPVRHDLGTACSLAGVPCPGKDMGVTGADVHDLVKEGDWQRVRQYNLGDTQATWALFARYRHAIPGHRTIDVSPQHQPRLAAVA